MKARAHIELPAGWFMRIVDQGPQIGEVWVQFKPPDIDAPPHTKVFDRASGFGQMLIRLKDAAVDAELDARA